MYGQNDQNVSKIGLENFKLILEKVRKWLWVKVWVVTDWEMGVWEWSHDRHMGRLWAGLVDQ